MLGAIIGDIIGSRFEFDNHRSEEFELFAKRSVFTDDSALTLAVARWLLGDGSLKTMLVDEFDRYPGLSYGGGFNRWASYGGGEPYNSYGNGAAMRVSAVGHFAQDESDCLNLAEDSAAVTHSHPEGIKGAQATAWSVWAALNGASAAHIRQEIQERFKYDMFKDWFSGYEYYVTCQDTVPPALICALEADSYEGAIRKMVSIGGDTDTICAIGGAVAEVLFGIPKEIQAEAMKRLDDHFRNVIERFQNRANKLSEHNDDHQCHYGKD